MDIHIDAISTAIDADTQMTPIPDIHIDAISASIDADIRSTPTMDIHETRLVDARRAEPSTRMRAPWEEPGSDGATASGADSARATGPRPLSAQWGRSRNTATPELRSIGVPMSLRPQ